MIGRILCAIGRHAWVTARGYESFESAYWCDHCGKEWEDA